MGWLAMWGVLALMRGLMTGDSLMVVAMASVLMLIGGGTVVAVQTRRGALALVGGIAGAIAFASAASGADLPEAQVWAAAVLGELVALHFAMERVPLGVLVLNSLGWLGLVFLAGWDWLLAAGTGLLWLPPVLWGALRRANGGEVSESLRRVEWGMMVLLAVGFLGFLSLAAAGGSLFFWVGWLFVAGMAGTAIYRRRPR